MACLCDRSTVALGIPLIVLIGLAAVGGARLARATIALAVGLAIALAVGSQLAFDAGRILPFVYAAGALVLSASVPCRCNW